MKAHYFWQEPDVCQSGVEYSRQRTCVKDCTSFSQGPMDPVPAQSTFTTKTAPLPNQLPSPPRILKTYHPYAASLYDVAFLRPAKSAADLSTSHGAENPSLSVAKPDQHVAVSHTTQHSPQDLSPGRHNHLSPQRRLTASQEPQRNRSSTSDGIAIPAAAPPATVLTTSQHSGQMLYTYGLPQPLVQPQQRTSSRSKNTLQSERDRYFALDGAADNPVATPPAPPRLRKPPTPPAQQFLALDGASAPPSRPIHTPTPNIDPALTAKPSTVPIGPFTCHPCSQAATYEMPGSFASQEEVLMHMHTMHDMPNSRLCCCGVCRFVCWEMDGKVEEGKAWLRQGGFGDIGPVVGEASGVGKVGGMAEFTAQGIDAGDFGTMGHGIQAGMEPVPDLTGTGALQWDQSFDELFDFGAGQGDFNFGS